ncbi:MAG: J domain-containing protein [Spirochaetaceae bacterium]|jgi:curved DNA-binding protein CbpA|nr:J domain-containing protein [Spirochaetaceae bacterium]
MENYYSLLGIEDDASSQDVKRAFREKAKRIHPDIVGGGGSEAMRKLLTAYEVLSDYERRYEYDRAYRRFVKAGGFDYREFLRAKPDDPASQAKFVFFELLHLEEEEALAAWRNQGGLDFPMHEYLGREDWMDCTYILAEELEKRECYYEAFALFVALVREERRLPYFRHFNIELENSLKELVRLRLKAAVDGETYLECLETLLELGFPPRDEARWMRSMAETLMRLGRMNNAETVFREALKRDPALPGVTQLRRKLKV